MPEPPSTSPGSPSTSTAVQPRQSPSRAPYGRPVCSHEDTNVIGITDEPVTALPQRPVQVIEHDVGQQRRKWRPLRGTLLARPHDSIRHDPGFQEPANQPQHPHITNPARHPGHQRIMLNPIKEPVQINVDHPPVAILDRPPSHPHRLMSGSTRTKTERRPREMRIEDRAEDLRNGLLHQPIQHTRHPQQPFTPAGLGNCYPTNRQWPVSTRVQRLPYPRPMINKPRTQIFRAHTVDPGRTTIGLDTFQRRRQVLPGEHQLPKAHLLAVNDLPDARRDITTLCCGLRRTHRLLPLQAHRSGMAAITVTSTSNTTTGVPPHVRSFPD